MSERLDLLSQNSFDNQFASAISDALKWPLQVHSSVESLQQSIGSNGSGVILVDCKDPLALQIAKDLKPILSPTSTIAYIIARGSHSLLGDIKSVSSIDHILFRPANQAVQSATTGTVFSRIVTGKKNDGLNRFLPSDVKISKFEIKNSKQKSEIVERINLELSLRKWDPRMALSVVLAADELMLNAIFSAPTDEKGVHFMSTLPRSTNVSIDPKFAVEVEFGISEGQAAITVRDRAGSLDRKTILKHIGLAFHEQNLAPAETQSSSGLGLAMVFKSGANLHFSLQEGVCTEVTANYIRASNYANFRNSVQGLSVVS